MTKPKKEPYNITKANKKIWEEFKGGFLFAKHKRYKSKGMFGNPKVFRPETPKKVKSTTKLGKEEVYKPNFFERVKKKYLKINKEPLK